MYSPPDPRLSARFGYRWQLGGVVVFNSVVALFLYLLVGGREGLSFGVLFAYSQCIGLTTHAVSHLLAWRAGRNGSPNGRDTVLSILLGSLLGTFLGAALTGTTARLFSADLFGFGAVLATGIGFGTIASHLFMSIIGMAKTRAALQAEELRSLAAEKALAEARLRLLQAQMEPHFLFNTLSTIHSLIDTRPQQAAHMLESFTDYLRTSLRRTREPTVTLAEELALVRAYLEVQRTRMGERLRFTIDLPPALAQAPLPPLLLQPLVENAVIHGLEPALAGGEVRITAREAQGRLRVWVEDNGVGFGASEGGSGLGLANVEARLALRYDEAARLTVGERPEGGVRVEIELPLPQGLPQAPSP